MATFYTAHHKKKVGIKLDGNMNHLVFDQFLFEEKKWQHVASLEFQI